MKVNSVCVLNEVASIYTKDQYTSFLESIDGDNMALFCAKKVVSMKSVFVLCDTVQQEEGFYIVPKSKDLNDLYYIAYFLNSLTGNIICLYDSDKGRYRKSISKKQLTNMEFHLASEGDKPFYAILQKHIFSLSKKKGDYDLLKKDLLSEIRDALSLEQVYPELFESYSISIFSDWKQMVGLDIENISPSNLFNELIRPDNNLMNDIKKLRVVLTKSPGNKS